MLTKKPKSIKDCYKLDKTSEQLIEWSHTLSGMADLIFYILIGLGITLFIAAAVVFELIDHEIISISSLSGGICCVIAAFIERAVLRSNSLLICANAHIVHNTRVTANLALYNACKNSDPSEYDDESDDRNETAETYGYQGKTVEDNEDVKENNVKDDMFDERTEAVIQDEHNVLYEENELDEFKKEVEKRGITLETLFPYEQSEELKEFISEIEKLDTETLAVIWHKQKYLYEDEQVEAIERELLKRLS